MKLPAHFLGFGSKSDGSAGLRFATQELTAEEFSELKRELNSFGWLIFSPQEQTMDVPTESISDETKKPSQRMRAVLYLIWQKKGSEGDFELFYRGKMEIIIERLKSKLDSPQNN